MKTAKSISVSRIACSIAAAALLALSAGIASADDTLHGSEILFPGQRLVSSGCYYRMDMQQDGNLVIYGGNSAHWATNTTGRGRYMSFQKDGNAVLYNYDALPIWTTNSGGHPGAIAVMQNDGNFVVYDDGVAVGSTHSGGTALGMTPCPYKSETTQIYAYAHVTGNVHRTETLARNSAIDCAYMCSQDATCVAFNYFESVKRCQMMDTYVSKQADFSGVKSGRIVVN